MEHVKIYGSPVGPESEPVKMHKKRTEKIEAKGEGKKTVVNADQFEGFNKKYIDLSWLGGAAEKYNLSSDISDYVVWPVPVVTSQLPNRNSQAFILKSLVEFEVSQGRRRYQTFIGKPTCQEHQNDDPNKVKGVNLDASLVKVPGYRLAKVIVLSAFDRTKDSDLVKSMLKNKINSFSMGATCTTFQCSVCSGLLGPGVKRTCTCFGTDYTNLKSLGAVKNGIIHYHIALDPIYIENSVVADPADWTANGNLL